MKYTTANKTEAQAAQEYLDRLVADKRTVEIKRVSQRRSLPQNSYLHLLLGAFGAHFGYTMAEAKTIYKQINDDIYHYQKKTALLGDGTFYRSSADLTKEEMTKTIERFRTFSSEAGYDLPLATDQAWLQSLENLIEQNRSYM